jgi:hypothetical protein
MALFQTSPSGYGISSNEDGSGQPLLGQRTFTVTSPYKGMAAGKRSRLDPEEETQLKEKYMEVPRASYTLTTEKDSEGSSKQRLTWLCCLVLVRQAAPAASALVAPPCTWSAWRRACEHMHAGSARSTHSRRRPDAQLDAL